MALKTRRSFLLLSSAETDTIASVYEDNSKAVANRAEVSFVTDSVRQVEAVPPCGGTRAAFLRKCVGCLKCLKACPRGLLKVSTHPGQFLRPTMDFRYDWCYPECSLCSSACPAGALGSGNTDEIKLGSRANIVVWDRTACLAAKGVKCNACLRHCPVRAVSHAVDGTPVVDQSKCIGCGACEHHCPARPRAAIHVEGRR